MALNDKERELIKGFVRRKRRYRDRNELIRRWYEFYFVEDMYAEQGQVTLATPDSRNAVDLGIYILSRNPHIDRIPRTIQNASQGQLHNMGERFLAGNWRSVDWDFIMQGLPWHQRRLASWLIMTGWYAQFTALIPDGDGNPTPVADLWDPAGVFPEWGGAQKRLAFVDHEYFYPLQALREMADANGWNTPNLDGDGSEIVIILDHWESRYNPQDKMQPDILNGVFVSTKTIADEPYTSWTDPGETEWMPVQQLFNRTTDSKKGGFMEIPVIVGPAGGVELSAAYARSASSVLAKLGQGLLASLEGVQDSINREMSTLLQEVEAARLGQSTPVISSPGGTATLEPGEMGMAQSYRDDTNITYPHRFSPQLASSQLVINFLNEVFQRSTFPWTAMGQALSGVSGVAIERMNEGARSHLEPYHYMMRHIYQATGQIWLRDYRRRWGGTRAGRVRLQGGVLGSDMAGFFDEEFSPRDIPDTNYIVSDIPWGLVEDNMMKANVARQLDTLMSKTWIRENILKVQDDQLEVRRKAGDQVEESPFFVNFQVMNRFRDEARAALERGDQFEAQMLARFASVLMQSLVPQEGRGIPPRGGQGPPEAGGTFNNAGGGRPELSPENMPPGETPPVEAPAGGGTAEQAERNIR